MIKMYISLLLKIRTKKQITKERKYSKTKILLKTVLTVALLSYSSNKYYLHTSNIYIFIKRNKQYSKISVEGLFISLP